LCHRWWVNSEIPKIIAMRDRLIEYFFWGVSTADEVELSSTRISIAKISNCATLLDDLIDDYATYEQLQLFKEVIVQGWDVSIVANMPPNFKFCLEFIVKTVHEVTNEATKRQGRDMMPFITKAVCILLPTFLLHICVCVCVYIYIYIYMKIMAQKIAFF